MRKNYFLSEFKSKYLSKVGNENLLQMEKSSQSILKKIQEQFAKGQRPTGIMYGKIQSGKTLAFLNLACMAFDEDWNICIILNSNNTFIAKQNKKRIEDFFQENEKVKIFSLGIDKKNELASENREALHSWAENGRKLIFIIPKNPSWMEKSYRFIQDSEKLFFTSKTLITDDEGDQSSLNNNALRNNKPPTTINNFIQQIRDKIPAHAFLSVTATPFANIIGIHVKEMAPNFVECVYPGKPYQNMKYYGIEEIWEEGSIIKDKTVKIITKKDIEILWETQNNNLLPLSLQKALSTFFVGTALLRKDEDLFGYEMIINPNIRLEEQKLVSKKVKNFLDDLKESVEKDDYLVEFVKKGLGEVGSNDNMNIDNLSQKVKREISHCMVEELNSESETNKSEELPLTNKIYIGSLSIGRGLSFKRLIVTYLTSRGKGLQNADTALQKSRWDGYKEEELFHLTRIWCTEEINEDYRWIRDCQKDLWKEMERQTNLLNWEKIFILGKKQRLTRPSIARQQRIKKEEKYLQYLPFENSKNYRTSIFFEN